MPIMIPHVIPDSASDSEKAIFETLKEAAEGRQWEVLHWASADSHRFDFLILSPSDCSIICLEVVIDRPYQFKNGEWSGVSGEPIKSPLDQAKNSMKVMKKHFGSSHFYSGSPLSLGYAVAFTDGTEIEEWLLPEHLKSIVGDRKLLGLGLMTGKGHVGLDALHPNTLGLILGEYATMFWNPNPSYADSMKAQLMLNELRTELVSTGETITEITTIFHDNLETHRPQLLRLTDDQLNVLEIVGCQPPSAISTESDNQIKNKEEPRCVIDGAAGTGKTVLAIEIARQRCKAGETVGLLCSNLYLSRRFTSWTETLSGDSGGKVIAGTPATLPSLIFGENQNFAVKHQQRLDESPDLEGSLKLGYLNNSWEQFIAETIEDLNTLEQGPVLDYLIVDEAQNLCDEMFLNLQNALLKNGLETGRWIMFGDFTNQHIVSPGIEQNGEDSLKNFGNLEWKPATLQTNCRNTHEITEKTSKLTNIPSPTMSGVYGPHVQIEYFESEEKLADILDNLILEWENRRFQSRQIILLSSGTGDEFNTNRDYSGWRLFNISEEPSLGENKTLRYSDVYDFQGLESDLVILVLPKTENMVPLVGGLTLPQENHLRRVLYTGMSRAKAMLVIVADEHWRSTLERRESLHNKLIEIQQAKQRM